MEQNTTNERMLELAASSESIINLLLSNGAVESTGKYKRNEDYETIETYMYGAKFSTIIESKCITRLSLNMYEGKESKKKYLKYRIHIMIPTPTGLRELDQYYSVGYSTKSIFENLSQRIDLSDLPVDLVKNLKISVTRRRSDGKIFENADLLSLSKL